MRAALHILFLSTLIFINNACDKPDVYETKAKSVDSLSGALNAMQAGLKNIDSLSLHKAVTRYNWYKEFIRQNVLDTISKQEADILRHFYNSGEGLKSFFLNRKLILDRAELLGVQLLNLSEDIKSRKPAKEFVHKFTEYEKKEVEMLIEAGINQQNVFHKDLEEFRNSLKGVEALIRSHNNGELPTIVKDTVQL